MDKPCDLSQACSTFPELRSPQISRRNLIDWFHDRFTPDRKVIIVQGIDGAGKSTLLAQFAKTFPERSICYFIKRDIWSSDPQRFLEELSEQLFLAYTGKNEGFEPPKDYYQLRQYFNKIYSQVAKKGRSQGLPYYFVIDGLEWVSETYAQESIIDILPHDPYPGMYLLASSSKEQQFKFAHEPIPIEFFGPTEVEVYLREIGVQDKKEIQAIYDVCKGMPGYLDQLRREINAGVPVTEVIKDLPKQFHELLGRGWDRIDKLDQSTLNALAVITHSDLPISIEELAKIVGIQENTLRNDFNKISFIKLSQNNVIDFVTDAHKRFVGEKLVNKRDWAEDALIKFYEEYPEIDRSQTQLPILYNKTGRYGALKSLVSVNYLSNLLQYKSDIPSIRKCLRIVTESARHHKDWPTLSNYSLIGAAFNTLSCDSPKKSEVEAYLELGNYQEAVGIAYQAVLPEDRLELLAVICEHIRSREENIPNDIIGEIDRLICNINPSDSISDRLIEISASLFFIHSQGALDLVEKVSKVDAKGRSIDILLAVLALKLEDSEIQQSEDVVLQDITIEKVRSRITDQTLREFAKVSSPLVGKLSPEQVINEVNNIEDISAKLFMLRSWCNANRNNPKSYTVVSCALELMTASPFSPSMRHLRQFAEPLLVADYDDINRLVDRFDLLKETAIRKPFEEAIRLELVLAAIESRNSKESANQRLLDAYLSLKDITELDTLCYCLVRVLLSVPSIDSSDPLQLIKEVEKCLPKYFDELLNNSADHFSIVKKILRALTNYKPEMAIEFAKKLNSVGRRDEAYGEIIGVYINRNPLTISIDLLNRWFDLIVNKSLRDQAFVRFLKKLSDEDGFKQLPKTRQYLNQIKDLIHPEDQCFAYAFSCLMLKSLGEDKQVNQMFEHLIHSWNTIDMLSYRVNVGFEIASILGKAIPEKAIHLIELSRKEKELSPLSSGRIAELYINTIKLAIRSFTDVTKDKDYRKYKSKLIDAIECIPSLEAKCILYGDLALRHFISGKIDDFRHLMDDHVFKTLDYCKDHEFVAVRMNILQEISPCLYEYERAILHNEIDQLDYYQKERALRKVILYLLSNRSISDPINIEQVSKAQTVEYHTALKICEVIGWMSKDTFIHQSISNLIDVLIKPHPRAPDREKCVLVERYALTIAERLIQIIDKLPDKANINHNGYKIVCYALIARLRSSSMDRGTIKWENLSPSWNLIAELARNIPNIADRVIVMSWVATIMYKSDINLASTLLKEAGELIDQIPNLIDRGSRFHVIADAWDELDDVESAKFFIREAMKVIQDWEWDQSRDQLTGAILQQAHAIEPEFAASLTSMVDNPIYEHEMISFLTVQELKNHPEKRIRNDDIDDFHYVQGRAAYQLLESLCSGASIAIQSEEQISQWIDDSFDSQFRDAYFVSAWSIENAIVHNRQRYSPALIESYLGLLDNLQLLWRTGQVLNGCYEKTKDILPLNPTIPESLQLYKVGSYEEALEALQDWLVNNAANYLKIYDAYFSPKYLSLLKSIPSNIRVFILTHRKSQIDITDDEKVIDSYRKSFSDLFGIEHPDIHVYIFGTSKTGEGPIHDRYYITDGGKGIQIGTSPSGLGNKDSSIRSMGNEETTAIEVSYIDKMLVNPPFYYQDERLYLLTFTLRH